MSDTFLTIQKTAEAIYKDKGSKFLAFAIPVSHEASIKIELDKLRKTYFDATHHCYAYILGPMDESYRANDDGEPNHSAGTPILGQIRAKNLKNVLVVVVRYFGGTKLGVSGLIQAYKSAAAMALENAQIIEQVIENQWLIRFQYPQMNGVMKLIKDKGLEIIAQQMDLECEIKIKVRLSIESSFLSSLNKIENLHYEKIEKN